MFVCLSARKKYMKKNKRISMIFAIAQILHKGEFGDVLNHHPDIAVSFSMNGFSLNRIGLT